MVTFSKKVLEELYVEKRNSSAQIAKKFSVGVSTVNYYLKKFNIQKRSISEAVYQRNNPQGDPFLFSIPKKEKDWFLYGLGLGLYWGEGTKKSLHAIRLGNTDPDLIKNFMDFLERIYLVKRSKFRFGLQLFTDISEEKAKDFWIKKLQVLEFQFYKTIVTVSRNKGTYTNKVKYGVITLYVNNKKLRDHLLCSLEKLRKM